MTPIGTSGFGGDHRQMNDASRVPAAGPLPPLRARSALEHQPDASESTVGTGAGQLQERASDDRPVLEPPAFADRRFVGDLSAWVEEFRELMATMVPELLKAANDSITVAVERMCKDQQAYWRKMDAAERARKRCRIMNWIMKPLVAVGLVLGVAALSTVTGGAGLLAIKAVTSLMAAGALTALTGQALAEGGVTREPFTVESLLEGELGQAGGQTLGGALTGNLGGLAAGVAKAIPGMGEDGALAMGVLFSVAQMALMAYGATRFVQVGEGLTQAARAQKVGEIAMRASPGVQGTVQISESAVQMDKAVMERALSDQNRRLHDTRFVLRICERIEKEQMQLASSMLAFTTGATEQIAKVLQAIGESNRQLSAARISVA